MDDHLSALALDELAAGDAPAAAVAAHLDGCSACARRLAALKEKHAVVSASPEARRRLDAVERSLEGARGSSPGGAPPSRPERLLKLALVASLPLAAALTFFVSTPPPADRLKGGATVALVTAPGDEIRSTRVGERVSLALGAAGWSHAAVFAVGLNGEVTQLWPEEGLESAPVSSGARVVVIPALQVSVGSFALEAYFTDGPRSVMALRGELELKVQEALQGGQSPLDVQARPSGAGAVAHRRIEVLP